MLDRIRQLFRTWLLLELIQGLRLTGLSSVWDNAEAVNDGVLPGKGEVHQSDAADGVDEVITFGRPAELTIALPAAAQRWDALVVDFQLTGGPQGDDVVRTAAVRDSGLPSRTVFTTGDISEDTQRRIAAAGYSTCLAKPFGLSLLLDAVRAIVERDGRGIAEERRRA